MLRILIPFLLLLLSAGVSFAQTSTWTDPAAERIVPAGQTITLDSAATAKSVTVRGTLRLSRVQASRLDLYGNLIVEAGGYLDMGTPADPVTVPHETVFHLTQAEALAFVGGGFAPSDIGLWVFGRWDAAGTPIARAWSRLAADALVGATSVTLADDVSDWAPGSQVVLTPTQSSTEYYLRSDGTTNTRNRNDTEVLTVASLVGNVVTFTTPVTKFHQASGDEYAQLGLLSHNVTIRTELEGLTNINDVKQRLFAHTAYMPGSSGNLDDIAFVRMGRYGMLGRYTVHHHRMGEGSRGQYVRGISCYEAGQRCTNIHESNGVTVEDAVSVYGALIQFFVERDFGTTTAPTSRQTDHVHVHNLSVSHLPYAGAPAGTPSTFGSAENGRLASAFWPGTSQHEAWLGNVHAGPSPTTATTSGFAIVQQSLFPHLQDTGTIPRTFVANEVQATREGFIFDAQFATPQFLADTIGLKAFGTERGLFHGAYKYGLKHYNLTLVDNRVGYHQNVSLGWIQDAVIKGRGLTAPRMPTPDLAMRGTFNSWFGDQPWYVPSRYTRVTIADITPGSNGALGIGIQLDFDPGRPQATFGCIPGPGGSATEYTVLAMRSSCQAAFLRTDSITFGPGLRPRQFGPHDNANTYWLDLDLGQMLIGKDQATPTGELSPLLMNTQGVYDPASDAFATPLTTLPATINFRDGALSLTPQAPPDRPVQTTARHGSVVTLTATPGANTTGVEFLCDWLTVGEGSGTAATTITVDLENLAAYGDTFQKRAYHYCYVRAWNDQNAADGYPLRAYSTVTEFGPQGAAVPPPPPPPPPNPPPTGPTVAELLQQIATLTQQRDAALAQVASLQQQLAAVQAVNASQAAQVVSLQEQNAMLQAALDLAEEQRIEREARIAQLQQAIQAALAALVGAQ